MKNKVKIFDYINITFLVCLAILTLYPIWYVLMYSLSSPVTGSIGGLYLIPKGGIFLETYKLVFTTGQIINAYKNTLFVVIVGTLVNMILSILTAYGLSKKQVKGNKFFMLAMVFTMLFNGGLIPTFLVVKSVGLYNSLWSLIIPGAISVYNVIILISFFRELPDSLEESAFIDGCSVPGILFKIVLPLSIPALATVTLFYAVAHWNSFFDCMLYITDTKKHVLQLILRNLVLQGNDAFMSDQYSEGDLSSVTPESIKMATIMIATLPIMAFYPFIQKYFVKGITLGAIKG